MPHDHNDLDTGWDDPAPDERPEPTPAPDVETLDAGWDDPRRHRTGPERAAARKAKARARAERQKAHAADVAQRQKKKRPRAASATPGVPSPTRRRPRETAREVARLALDPSRTKRSWKRMLAAVAVIVLVAAFVLFVVAR